MNEEMQIDREKIQKMYTESLSNRKWLAEHYKELTQEYNNMFVAVYNGKVIDFDIDPRKLLKKLKERGLDVSIVAIDFITKDPLLYIL